MEYEPTEQAEPMSDEAKMGLWIFGSMAAVLFGMMVIGGIQSASSRADAAAQAAAQPAGPPGLASRFTKSEFDNHVFGKTKDQIRAEFGSPGRVDDASDEWTYFDVPVFDAEAGTKVQWASIRFEGIAGGGDQVASVSFD